MKTLSLLLLFSQMALAGGQDVGSGGDLILCKKSPANKLEGQLALDYVLTLGNNDSGLVQINDWRASMYRIRQNLERSVPELLQSFDEFNRYIKNKDKSKPRLWESTPFSLIHVKDQSLPSAIQLPSNCRESDKIPLIRAIVRQHPEFSGSKTIVYKYMEESFDKMEKESPLQLSFLLVHEWLWDLSDNVDRNRRMNRLFHSVDFDKMDAKKISETLNALGLNVKDLPTVVDKNLPAAIESSFPGQTLILKPGTYSIRGFAVRHPLTIKGEGKPEDIIIDSVDEIISTADVNISNVTLRREIPSSEPARITAVLKVIKGSTRLGNVKVSGGIVGILLGDGKLTVDNTKIKSERVAIYVDGQEPSLKITNSALKANSAFQFRSPATLDASGNTFIVKGGDIIRNDSNWEIKGKLENNKILNF